MGLLSVLALTGIPLLAARLRPDSPDVALTRAEEKIAGLEIESRTLRNQGQVLHERIARLERIIADMTSRPPAPERRILARMMSEQQLQALQEQQFAQAHQTHQAHQAQMNMNAQALAQQNAYHQGLLGLQQFHEPEGFCNCVPTRASIVAPHA